MRIIIKDKFGNQLVENSEGAIGVRNVEGKFITKKETSAWIKENKLGNKIILTKYGFWLDNKFLKWVRKKRMMILNQRGKD